jgi:sterol desaturase/sphingolipid hydroxylase (fatty acid hydroxylase superfamily)
MKMRLRPGPDVRPDRIAVVAASASGHAPVRIFRSDFLERLTHTNVTTIVVFWSSVLGSLFAWGLRLGQFRLWQIVFIVIGGVASWSLFEYGMHRFLFHIDRWIPRAHRLSFTIHGCHHNDPADASRDIMPLIGSVPFFSASIGAAVILFGPAFGLTFEAAFGLAYLAYDVTHYGCHQWQLPGRWAARIKRHHLLHHYVDETRNFGVTSAMWDRVFGTFAQPGTRADRK